MIDKSAALRRLNGITMEAVDLKAKFHNLIDLIDNYDVLEDFYRVMNDYYEKNGSSDIIDDLTDAQKIRLNESIQQSESGKTIPHEIVKSEIKKWLTK
jgi:hypothetical protein